jgi:alkanesulfonate monooxygenase SsuD/methylene tetrahydromethanopterin reductase-like flavin-dependent oxidoreductase (luciferase family)
VSDRTIQLRRYKLVPEERAAFVEWWRREIPPARGRFGFEVLFGYLVPETDEFVWAVAHEGDADAFRQAEQEYTGSPERAAAFAGQPDRVREMLVQLVEPV